MEPLQHPEDRSNVHDPTAPANSNTDILMEDADAPPSESPKINPEKPSEPEEADSRRRDSVLSEDRRPSTSPNEQDTRDPATGEKLDPESPLLKTPSGPASPKESPNLRSRPTPNLGQSILKTPPATGESKLSKPQPPKTPGSIWTLKYGGKAWPLILCDENSAPEVFIKSRQSDSHLPSILLGKRIYIWVTEKHLKPFEKANHYLKDCERFDSEDVLSGDNEAAKTEKLRQRAFRQDVEMNQSHHFWANALQQERMARRADDRRRGIKRRRSDHGGLSAEERWNAENKGMAKKRKAGNHRHRSPLRGFRLLEEGKPDLEDSLLHFDESADDQERIQASYKNDVQQRKGSCKIFVGNDQTKTTFEVPNSALAQCVELSRLVHYTNHKREDSYIKLFESHKIDAKSFEPIATFLRKGSFSPHVIKGPYGPVLEGLRTAKHVNEAAQHLGRVYHAASHLHFAELQQYCVEKLDYLPALSPLGLGIVMACFLRATVHKCSAERNMQHWLAARIVGSFWELMREQGPALVELLKKNDGLRRHVIGEVARREGVLHDTSEVSDEESDSEDLGDEDSE